MLTPGVAQDAPPEPNVPSAPGLSRRKRVWKISPSYHANPGVAQDAPPEPTVPSAPPGCHAGGVFGKLARATTLTPGVAHDAPPEPNIPSAPPGCHAGGVFGN